MLSKAHHPEKLQDTFAMKHWIQTTSINVLNSSYAKRRRKLYQGFAVNTLNLKKYFQKRLPTILLASIPFLRRFLSAKLSEQTH